MTDVEALVRDIIRAAPGWTMGIVVGEGAPGDVWQCYNARLVNGGGPGGEGKDELASIWFGTSHNPNEIVVHVFTDHGRAHLSLTFEQARRVQPFPVSTVWLTWTDIERVLEFMVDLSAVSMVVSRV